MHWYAQIRAMDHSVSGFRHSLCLATGPRSLVSPVAGSWACEPPRPAAPLRLLLHRPGWVCECMHRCAHAMKILPVVADIKYSVYPVADPGSSCLQLSLRCCMCAGRFLSWSWYPMVSPVAGLDLLIPPLANSQIPWPLQCQAQSYSCLIPSS